ncbi:10347_t:CDS:10 [Paraglomus occultum]|uniref:10347_t:CDS:1 n=1 Tax=Paraglomus occultum TaxID=144539 RepID=A0A9N9A5S2_9GLOM|nr:10347_t:CDS:10 [Paraglomus occultum]
MNWSQSFLRTGLTIISLQTCDTTGPLLTFLRLRDVKSWLAKDLQLILEVEPPEDVSFAIIKYERDVKRVELKTDYEGISTPTRIKFTLKVKNEKVEFDEEQITFWTDSHERANNQTKQKLEFFSTPHKLILTPHKFNVISPKVILAIVKAKISRDIRVSTFNIPTYTSALHFFGQIPPVPVIVSTAFKLVGYVFGIVSILIGDPVSKKAGALATDLIQYVDAMNMMESSEGPLQQARKHTLDDSEKLSNTGVNILLTSLLELVSAKRLKSEVPSLSSVGEYMRIFELITYYVESARHLAAGSDGLKSTESKRFCDNIQYTFDNTPGMVETTSTEVNLPSIQPPQQAADTLTEQQPPNQLQDQIDIQRSDDPSLSNLQTNNPQPQVPLSDNQVESQQSELPLDEKLSSSTIRPQDDSLTIIQTEGQPLAQELRLPQPSPRHIGLQESVEQSVAGQAADSATNSSNSIQNETAKSSQATQPIAVTGQGNVSSQSTDQMPQKKLISSKKSNQPIHILLVECGKEYITGYLTKKSEEDTTVLFSDRKKLHADFKLYCNEIILKSARDRIINELDEKGKEALDVRMASDACINRLFTMKAKLEDSATIYKCIADAMDEVKAKYPEVSDNNWSALINNGIISPEMAMILRIWIQCNKKEPAIPPVHGGHSEQPRSRGRGHMRGGYWLPRGGPPRYSPYPQGPPRRREWPVRDERDFRDRRVDGDHFRDRRDEYARREFDRRPDFRGGPLPPPPPPLPFGRDRPPMVWRDDVYHRYDDRRRDVYDRRPDERHGRDLRGPPMPPMPVPIPVGPPIKATPAIYESPPMPPASQLQQTQQTAYDYQQYSSDQQQYSTDTSGYQQDYSTQTYPGYYPQYPPDGQLNGQSTSNYQYTNANNNGWDAQGNPVQPIPIQLTSFSWNQPGRHGAIPLPTDFMSGPSNAPRLSMPEPHDVLGVIKGVIIRDAQGNIGLSQYTFTTM